MNSDDWKMYKATVQNIRDSIAIEYKQLYAVLEKCKCIETKPRITHSNGFDTFFDECVVCLKIHNVHTDKVKPVRTEEQIAKRRERNKARRFKKAKKN